MIGEKLAKPRKIVTDKGAPQFFYEIVQYWVTYDLVQIIAKYGLMPDFNDNLKAWSSDIYNIVQLLRNDTMTDEESKRGNLCFDMLYDAKQTVHWSNFARCGLGHKKHLRSMTIFSLPLVMITWQRMLVEYFHVNTKKTFFEKGNYEPQQKANTRCPLNNLHLGSGKVESVDEMRARTTDNQVVSFNEFTIKRNLSLAYWADKILQKDADFDMTKEPTSKRGPPETDEEETYQISDKTIKWEKEKDEVEDIDGNSEGAVSKNAIEHNVCEATEMTEQLIYIAEAMNVAKTTIGKIRKKTKAQTNNERTVQNGCASLVQLTKNELKIDKDMTWDEFMDWIRNTGNDDDNGEDNDGDEKEEDSDQSEILDAKKKSSEPLYVSDGHFQGNGDDSDESNESDEIDENGVLCGEDGEEIPVEVEKDKGSVMGDDEDGEEITDEFEKNKGSVMSDGEKQNSDIEHSGEKNETNENKDGRNDGEKTVDSIEEEKNDDKVSEKITAETLKDKKRKQNERIDTDAGSEEDSEKILDGKRKGGKSKKKKKQRGDTMSRTLR